jgi:RND family efflux transporter MFP subunit
MIRYRPILFGAAAVFIVAGLAAIIMRIGDAPVDSETDENAEPVVSVSVAPIVKATFHEIVAGWGHVEPEPAMAGRPPASAQVASPIAGLLASVLAGEGQRVDRDAVLFRLDSRLADVAVDRARAALRFAEQQMARQERLRPGEVTSRKAYERAQQQVQEARAALALAERERSLLTIRAPIAGTIVRLNARLGDTVESSRVLAEIMDLRRLVVSAGIRSAEVGLVKVGQPADLVTEAGTGDGTLRGTSTSVSSSVVYVGTLVNRTTDAVVVRVSVPPASGLRPGQLVTARILVETRQDRLAVPVDSVLPDPDGPSIAIVAGNVAIKRPVTVGVREGALREIEGDGLREGMLVAVEGAFDLSSRTTVSIRNSAPPSR